MRYSNLKEMPMMTAIGFEHLCKKFDRGDGGDPHEAAHDMMMEKLTAGVSRSLEIDY